MTPTMADHPASADGRAGRSSVKTKLTPNRRRQPVENDKYACFVHLGTTRYARGRTIRM